MPRGKKKTKYSFPILKTPELTRCINELGVPMKESDIRNPREDRVKSLYVHILDRLFGVDVNAIHRKNQLSAGDSFTNASLHENSVYIVTLLRHCCFWMTRIGVVDFNISDLITPQHKRTQRNLSAVINFAKFKIEKWKMLEPFHNKMHALDEKYRETVRINNKIGDEAQVLIAEIQNEKPRVNELKKQIDDIEAQIHETIPVNIFIFVRLSDFLFFIFDILFFYFPLYIYILF